MQSEETDQISQQMYGLILVFSVHGFIVDGHTYLFSPFY